MKTFFVKHFFWWKHVFLVNISFFLVKTDCLFPDFTRKCVNFIIATTQHNFSANTVFTRFTSSHRVYLTIAKKRKEKKVTDRCLVEVRAVQAGSAKMAFPL